MKLKSERSLLRSKLSKFRAHHHVYYLIRKLFSEDPRLVNETLCRIQDPNFGREGIVYIHRFIEDLIIDILSSSEKYPKLSKSVYSYVSVIDLVGLCLFRKENYIWYAFRGGGESESGSSGVEDPTSIINDETRYKVCLEENFPPESVNFIDVEVDHARNVFFRILSVSNDNLFFGGDDDDNHLYRMRPVYVAYSPGIPYFYSNVRKLDAHIGKAVSKTLFDNPDYTQVSLMDRNLESLIKRSLKRQNSNDNSKENEEQFFTVLEEPFLCSNSTLEPIQERAMGEGSGVGRGGNVLWMIIWFLLLIFIAFPVAGFCAGWYILLMPLTVCITGLAGLTDFLLKGVQFTYFCADHLMKGTPVGDAFG